MSGLIVLKTMILLGGQYDRNGGSVSPEYPAEAYRNRDAQIRYDNGLLAMVGNGSGTQVSKSSHILKYFGERLSLSAGFGLFHQGLEIQAGFIGFPATIGRMYFSIGAPYESPIFLDCSFSAQYHFGVSENQSFYNINGKGNSFGISGFGISGSYTTDNPKDPSYNIFGIGPSIGVKYSGGHVNTQTWSIPFFFPLLFDAVGGHF